jgi:hypothetical protein
MEEDSMKLFKILEGPIKTEQLLLFSTIQTRIYSMKPMANRHEMCKMNYACLYITLLWKPLL